MARYVSYSSDQRSPTPLAADGQKPGGSLKRERASFSGLGQEMEVELLGSSAVL